MTITELRPAAAHWTGVDLDAHWITMAQSLAPRLAERAAGHDRAGTFVADGMRELCAAGLTSMLVPAELGGGGASFAETGAVLAELARACPATALTLSMHSHLVAAQVWRHQRGLPAPVLAKVAAGAILVSTGASDWLGSGGTATKAEGGYRISARKSPASGAPAGDIVVTSIRWDAAPDGPQVLHLAVPFTADGVRVEETWDTMGMRGTGSHTIVFDDVFVPEAAVSLARPADVWHPIWGVVVGVAMPLIMSVYVGVAEEAVARATSLAVARGADDAVRLLGRMRARLRVAQDVAARMVAASDGFGFESTLEQAASVLERKRGVTDAVLDAVRLALEAGGGAAYSTDAGLERLFRDAHGALYHPLPADRQERFSGRLALGLDPA